MLRCSVVGGSRVAVRPALAVGGGHRRGQAAERGPGGVVLAFALHEHVAGLVPGEDRIRLVVEDEVAPIAADQLSVTPEEIEVVHTETDLLPTGVGSWASRSTVVGGSAVMLAAKATAEKALRVAAGMLEAATEDLRLESAGVWVAGSPDKSVSLGEIAAACEPHSGLAEGEAPGLGSRRTFSVDHMTYPYGVHLTQVEVDSETGGVEIRRYFVAYEVGRAVNPTLVEVQLVGGAAQGLGGPCSRSFATTIRGSHSPRPLSTTWNRRRPKSPAWRHSCAKTRRRPTTLWGSREPAKGGPWGAGQP